MQHLNGDKTGATGHSLCCILNIFHPINFTATPGALPGTAIEHQAEVLAVLKAINTVTVAFPEDMNIIGLKVGSEVRAMYIEAVAMHIAAAPATPAKPAAPAAQAEKK